MGRPAEGLRRQGSASWPVIPWLTPPTGHTLSWLRFMLAPHSFLKHTLCGRGARNARWWPNAFWQSCGCEAEQESQPTAKPRHAKHGAAILALCAVWPRRGPGGSFIVKKSPLRRTSASATASASAPGVSQWPGNRRPGAVWPVNRALFFT